MPPGSPTLSVEDMEQRPGRPGGEQRARGPSAHPELVGSSPWRRVLGEEVCLIAGCWLEVFINPEFYGLASISEPACAHARPSVWSPVSPGPSYFPVWA